MTLFLASLPQEEYQIVLQIFEKFEECELKDQSLSRAQRGATRNSKLDCKGGYFKPLRGIDPSTRKELLQQVLDGDLSFRELASSCKYAKKMRDVQVSFMRYLDLPSWEVAMDKYPEQTKNERLEPFLDLPFKTDSMPPSFVSFCQLAKQSLATHSGNNPTNSSELKNVLVGKTTALLLNKDVLGVETDYLLSLVRSHGFCGFNLTIIDPPKVCS